MRSKYSLSKLLGILSVFFLFFITFNNTLALENSEENHRENYGVISEPYFQTEIIPYSDNPTTITVQNRWNTTLTIDVQNLSDSTITTYIISGSTSSAQFSFTPTEDVYLTIRPSSADGFRDWQHVTNPFVTASGQSASQASSFVHIPEMNYFTTNSTGTQAGNYFFEYFFLNSQATSLPVGSFDISSIKTVGNNFFGNFAQLSRLTSLPINSFNTSSITSVARWFFSAFAYRSSLTTLPVGSFNISSITTAPDGFFYTFAYMSSLTTLPVGSFNTSNISSADNDFFYSFAYNTPLGKASSGISIKNVSTYSVTFYWASNSGSQDIGSKSTFCCYSSDPYFQTETIPSSTNATTITVSNRWDTTLTIDVLNTSGITISTYTISDSTSSIIFSSPPAEAVYLIIQPESVDGFRNWQNVSNPFVTASGQSASQASSFVQIPDINNFTVDSAGTQAGNYFFQNFFKTSQATSLPVGSFNTSSITSVGNNFFSGFARSSSLTSLPAGSFNTSSIASAGNSFFSDFAYHGSLTSLPVGSFNTSSITSADDNFFSYFAFQSPLTSLPDGSFNTSNIISVDDNFFSNFAYNSSLTSLPAGSFNTSSITSVGDNFFSYYAQASSLASLPENSFNTSSITSVGESFFSYFAASSSLTSLPVGSFNTSSITSIGDYFFYYFAQLSSLNSLPAGSFDISTITSAGNYFFRGFADSSSITSLPAGSFDTSNITTAGDNFFTFFAYSSLLSSLPADSFNISSINTAGNYFLQGFAVNSPLAFLPAGSFDTSNITTVGGNFFTGFAYNAPLRKANSGVSIKNVTTSSVTFNYSGGYDVIDSGSTFCCYEIIPYFETQTIPASSNTTTITIQNRWNTTLTIEVRASDDGDILSTTNISGSTSSAVITLTPPEAVYLNIRAGSVDGFRDWQNVANPFVTASGQSASQASSFVYIPDMSYFTVDSSGTQAGNYFFQNFFKTSPATSLPAGSFNTSYITSASNYFFDGFADSSSLISFPAGSFNTSYITSVGSNFFSNFAQSSRLISLPAGSFNTSNIITVGEGFFSNFAFGSQLDKDSPGVSIKNISSSPVTFYWALEGVVNSGSQKIASKDTFCCYQLGSSDDPIINNISPKSVQNTKATTVTLSGLNLQGSYSFRITSSHFINSNLPSASKTYNKLFPSSSIIAKTYSSATLKIPATVNWVGSYTIELLFVNGYVPTKTFITYQLALSSSSVNFSDTSTLTTARKEAIIWLAQAGVTGGCNTAGTKYCPNEKVNRGSMAVFLQLLGGNPAGSSSTSTFADVFAGSSKTVTYVSGSKTSKEKVSALSEKRIAAVNWLALTGITGGSGSAKVNGKNVQTYRPQDTVNRGAMASFMLKFSENVVSTITSDAQTGFADIKIGSGNFTITYKGSTKGEKVAKLTAARATAVKWMQTVGITGGSGTDKNGKVTFRAQDSVNRGSMATFMKNLAVYMGYTS